VFSRCFVCGIRGPEFDRLGVGFDFHSREEHNAWNYFSCYCYLVDRFQQYDDDDLPLSLSLSLLTNG
jgi:hypothetical protein